MKVLPIILVSLLLLTACNAPVCKKPYILVGRDCCLDSDDNKICDKDETFEEKSTVVITEKEPKIIEKEVKKYVCSDGTVVESTLNCPIEKDEPVKPKKIIPIPNLKNEVGTAIETISIRSACVGGANAGEIFFKIGTVPDSVAIEVKEVKGEYEEVFSRTGLYDGYIYFSICENCYKSSFSLKPDKVYLLRMKFDQTPVFGKIEYSNEHVIDTHTDSELMSKVCAR